MAGWLGQASSSIKKIRDEAREGSNEPKQNEASPKNKDGNNKIEVLNKKGPISQATANGQAGRENKNNARCRCGD